VYITIWHYENRLSRLSRIYDSFGIGSSTFLRYVKINCRDVVAAPVALRPAGWILQHLLYLKLRIAQQKFLQKLVICCKIIYWHLIHIDPGQVIESWPCNHAFHILRTLQISIGSHLPNLSSSKEKAHVEISIESVYSTFFQIAFASRFHLAEQIVPALRLEHFFSHTACYCIKWLENSDYERLLFWLGGMFSRNAERPLFCAAQISNLLRHVKVRRRGAVLRLLAGVIHPAVFQVELAREEGRYSGERASSSRRSGGRQRGQEVRQSGKKAGERVLGFVEVGGKSGSGGERKVSFRSRRSLARPPVRPLARS